MSRSCRISRARTNCSASIQRRSRAGTLPRAKLQKLQVALQEFVTATLQNPGSPRRISRTMSHAFEIPVFTSCHLTRERFVPDLEIQQNWIELRLRNCKRSEIAAGAARTHPLWNERCRYV